MPETWKIIDMEVLGFVWKLTECMWDMKNNWYGGIGVCMKITMPVRLMIKWHVVLHVTIMEMKVVWKCPPFNSASFLVFDTENLLHVSVQVLPK